MTVMKGIACLLAYYCIVCVCRILVGGRYELLPHCPFVCFGLSKFSFSFGNLGFLDLLFRQCR